MAVEKPGLGVVLGVRKRRPHGRAGVVHDEVERVVLAGEPASGQHDTNRRGRPGVDGERNGLEPALAFRLVEGEVEEPPVALDEEAAQRAPDDRRRIGAGDRLDRARGEGDAIVGGDFEQQLAGGEGEADEPVALGAQVPQLVGGRALTPPAIAGQIAHRIDASPGS